MLSTQLIMTITAVTTSLFIIKRLRSSFSKTLCFCSPKEKLHLVITGGTSGIGRSALNFMIPHIKTLSLICRDSSKADLVKHQLGKHFPNTQIDVHIADLANLDSIENLKQDFAEKDQIDVLVNNAGLISLQEKSVCENVDMNALVNYFGTVKLTETLMPYLSTASFRLPRIVFVSSSLSAKSQAMDSSYEKFFKLEKFNPMSSYGVSKHALNIYANHLKKELKGKVDVYTVVTGGVVKTNLNREIKSSSNFIKRFLLNIISSLFFLKPEIGCQSLVHCAMSDNVIYAHSDTASPPSMLFRDCKPVPLYGNVSNSHYKELLNSTFDLINKKH